MNLQTFVNHQAIEGWQWVKLSYSCDNITDGSHFSPEAATQGRPDVTVRDIVDDRVDARNAKKISAADFEQLEHNGCRPKVGDVLFSKDGTIGKVALVCDNDFVVLSSLAILRPSKRIRGAFLRYALSTPSSKAQMEYFLAGAALRRVTLEVLKNLVVPVPDSIEKQDSIVKFLDEETAKADALVAKYERLIELLEEKRVALITQAVTMGLDPAVPLRNSGIIGVGNIPQHWGIVSVWMLFEIGRGRVISHEDILDNPGPYPVYSSQTENGGEMGTIETYDFDGDFLTWTTDGAKAGTVFERHGRFNCTNVCGTLRLRDARNNLAYFKEVIDLASTFFVRLDINPKLMNDVMARIRVPLPPAKEQAAIVEFILPHVQRVARLKSKASRAIALIKEHRSAVIAAAVTGQIDVSIYKHEDYEVPA
jgi:type I restriction enzyme, S subunit